MRLFHGLYRRALLLSRHRHARFYLMGLSFLEAFVLPVSPAVLQIPLTLTRPRSAWRYAWYAFVGSFVGGIVGYLIGYFVIRLIMPHYHGTAFYHEFMRVQGWIALYGIWILFPISLLPLPYKITTIASGILGIPFWHFLIATAPARAIHFSFVAYIMRHDHMKSVKRYMMRRYSEARSR